MSEELDMRPLEPPERIRVYHFPGGSTIRLEDVRFLCVRPSGTHRLQTGDGRKWIIPPSWLAIELDVDAWTF